MGWCFRWLGLQYRAHRERKDHVCSNKHAHALRPGPGRASRAEGYDRKLVAELWPYPDNSMILELSTKCAPSEAFQVAAETRAVLTQRGVDLAGEQETKTKKSA
jgi:hypothetical protein